MASITLPTLPYDEWVATKETLHLYCQIIGKIRLQAHPKLNHWWHVPLYVSPRGLSTHGIPYDGRMFQFEFDLLDHCVRFQTSDGVDDAFPLTGQSAAEFYETVFAYLAASDIPVTILARPYEHPSTIPFPQDRAPRTYDPAAVTRYHRALVWIDGVFEEFRGRTFGKETPVHMFWHSFDLALTRFSGRPAPPMPEGTRSNKEAYSHEVISVGFWAGDAKVPQPAFYAYVAPEPAGVADKPLAPASAWWQDLGTSHMALLKYDDVRTAADPRGMVLDFCESAYQAGLALADWPDTATQPTHPFWAQLDQQTAQVG